MERDKIIMNTLPNGITAFIGDFKLDFSYVVNGFIDLDLSVKEYLMSVTSEDKIQSSLKMVLFDKDVNSIIKNLSYKDKKKVQLAYALCNKENYLFLEYFDKGLTLKEKNYFKKLLKKIKEYQISIIIHTNDMVFLFDLADKISLVQNENIIEMPKVDFYNDELYKFIDEPEIVDFINYCRKNNIDLDSYIDNKELIKAIFRMVS